MANRGGGLRSTGLTLGAHPLELLREQLAASTSSPSADLRDLPHGSEVRVAGIVLLRQHPQSANGVTFMTIEDETGLVNIIVWESVWRARSAAPCSNHACWKCTASCSAARRHARDRAAR